MLLPSFWIAFLLAVGTALGVLAAAAAAATTTSVTSPCNRRTGRLPFLADRVIHAVRGGGRIGATVNRSSIVAVPIQATATISKTVPPPTSPFQMFVQTILEARRHLTAAAIARSTSIFIMYPADVFKTRLQMQQPDALRLSGLFNGVTGSLLGQVPYGVLTFGSYEMYKSYLLDRLPNVQPIFKYAAGT
jgi:hypothetical protein